MMDGNEKEELKDRIRMTEIDMEKGYAANSTILTNQLTIMRVLKLLLIGNKSEGIKDDVND